MKERGFPRPLELALGELKIPRRGLPGAPVGLDLEGNLLTLDKAAQTRALKGADMDENILAAVVRLDEAVALLTVIPFYDAHIHGVVPFASDAQSRVWGRGGLRSLERGRNTCARSRKARRKRPNRPAQIDPHRIIRSASRRNLIPARKPQVPISFADEA